jgi:hypothetical protein
VKFPGTDTSQAVEEEPVTPVSSEASGLKPTRENSPAQRVKLSSCPLAEVP